MHVEVSILICSTLIDCLLFNILFKDSSLPIWRHNYPKMTETFRGLTRRMRPLSGGIFVVPRPLFYGLIQDFY